MVPQPPLLQLSSANIDRHGAYLMDTGSHMYLWLGAAVSDRFCEDVFEQPNFKSIQDNMVCYVRPDNMVCFIRPDNMVCFIGPNNMVYFVFVP